MPRPSHPWWWKARGRWAATIGGKRIVEPIGIGQQEKPMRSKIPVRVWDWFDKIAERERPEELHPDELTVEGLCGKYLKWAAGEVAAGRLDAGTYRGNQTKVGRFCWFRPLPGAKPYASKRVAALTANDLATAVQAWQTQLRGSKEHPLPPYKPHYVRGLTRAISTVFAWAARPVPGRDPERLISDNPLAGFEAPKVPRSPDSYLNALRFRSFLRWAWRRSIAVRRTKRLTSRFDRVFVLMIQFLRHTGARPGEACKLEWGDIDWKDRVAVLPPERWKNGKKTGRPREISLTPPVIRILRTLERQPWRHPTHVFAHRRGRNGVDRGAAAEQGEPWNSTAAAKKIRDWRQWAQADGIDIETKGPLKVVAYVARHTYISDGLMAGLSSDVMAGSCGTSVQMVTTTYGHLQRGETTKQMDDLAVRRRSLLRGDKEKPKPG